MMNTATIEKAIALFDGAKLEELRNLLIYEREKSILESNGKKMKLAPIVRRILKRNETSRPVLSTVMYDEQNRPCICDGYMLVRWNAEQQELKACPETRGERVLSADKIIPKQSECEERSLTGADRLIIANISKYIKLYDKEKAQGILPVCLFGKIFNAYLVKDFIDVIGTDFDKTYTRNLSYSYGERENCPDTIYHKDFSAVILPFRMLEEKDKERCEARTDEFLERLKA